MTTIRENPSAAFLLGGDLPVARLGFGAMRLPAREIAGPANDPETSAAVLRRAVELGVNHIDTAWFYFHGGLSANGLIRRVLHPCPEDLVLAFTAGAGLGLLWLSAVTARLADRWPTAVPPGIIDTTKIITIRNGAPMTDAVKGPASYFPSIEKKYGRPIAEWKDLIRSSPLTKHMELVTWLKSEHGLGHGHANALVAHTLAEDSAK